MPGYPAITLPWTGSPFPSDSVPRWAPTPPRATSAGSWKWFVVRYQRGERRETVAPIGMDMTSITIAVTRPHANIGIWPLPPPFAYLLFVGGRS